LFISNLYPPNVIGGYERLCFEVVSALVDRGHEAVVLTSDYGGRVADYPGQEVHRRLRLLAGVDIYAPLTCSDQERADINRVNIETGQRLIGECRPDAIFIWNLFFLDKSFIASLFGQTKRQPLLMLTDNWLIVMLNPEFMSNFFRDHVFSDNPYSSASGAHERPGAILARARQYLRRLVDAPRAPTPLPFRAAFGSKFMRELYAASGIRFADSRVVHNGVRQPPRPPEAFRDRSRLVEDNELRLLFAGRLVDLKGVHTAVEAMTYITGMELGGRFVRLTIVGDRGDTAYVERLGQLIAQSPCASQIELRDPVPESDLFAVFQTHDIYLFPSLYEPFSLTLIHALAAGIPTVATNIGGNIEIVCDRETGLLFQKGDPRDLARAVQQLATDNALRAHLGENARRVAKSFTFQKMVTQMEQFLAG
jgi:glycosyltransferase involved in cell wall biosynthesis